MSRRSSSVFVVDPARPAPPEDLQPPDADIGEIVAILAEQGARESGWSAPLVVELAARWAEGGLKVFLADADLAGATLHGLVGVENDEGVADAILYGASTERVAREISRQPGVQFVPAGTAVFELSGAYRHPRWVAFLSSLRDSRATLLLYLPAEAEGVSVLAQQADQVIRLTAGEPDVEGEEAVTVICGPTSSSGSSRSGVTEERRTADDTTEGKKPLVRVGSTSAGSAKGSPWKGVLLAVLVLVLALLIVGWLGYIRIPGVTPGALFAFAIPEPPLTGPSLPADASR